ncbi:hypothetical protein BELL_0239g00110 [Botrytis elliptica]|uniref:AAA+ ATPase domain-containing protein n=1 Tax=Botrytis elliptica TaxID=278938 RepID=A0A4Z1JN04_9HELO|nr:hypothetical protein BELL_0239g00110 [Botrytis elliptica]
MTCGQKYPYLALLAVEQPSKARYKNTLTPEQWRPEPESAKLPAPLLNVGKTRITISDNLSTDENKKNRRLLALKPRSPKPASKLNLDISDNQLESYNPGEIGPGGLQETRANHASPGKYSLPDYQMQLMLLEQQNKRRLIMERQEQANEVFGGSEYHGPVTYGSDIPQANGHNSLNHSDQMKRGLAHMDNYGMTSLPLLEGQFTGSYSGDNKFSPPGGPTDPITNSPYLNNMSPTNIDIFGIPPSSYPGATSNKMAPQQMTLIQQQQAAMARRQESALQNQQQMAMNRPQAVYPMHGTSSPIQNKPLAPQVDSVADLFSALGIDAIAMGIPSESLENVQAFREFLQQIQVKEPSRCLILHRIKGKKEQIYFDPPEWVMGQSQTRIMKSRLPLSNLTGYLEKNTDISFVVFRDYEENHMQTSEEMIATAATDKNTGIVKSPVHEEEKILAVSEHLTEAIKSILNSKPEFADLLTWFGKKGAELPSPFVFIYHSREFIQELIEDTSDPRTVRQLKLMIEYISKNYGEEYDTADAMFEESRVAIPYFKYLFKPGDVLVEGTGSDINGYMFVTWPHDSTSITASLKEDGKNKPSSQYTMDVRSWSFDGAFNRVSTRLTLEIDGSEKTEYAIRDLNIRPIAYASDEDRKTLQSRGEMFWKCRERHFVSYQEHGRGDLHGASEERYMIDMKTLRELHPEDEKKTKAPYPEDGKKKASNTLDEDAMAQDGPPDPSFVYLLPQKITGYNMRRKEWVELHANWLSEVIWDKKAFKKLVLARKTKDLVEALIVNQIAAEKSTDLISGKGNGLILLLHGGPGTGKTLTAESVAEIAERPLYRVTCGDIGSEPEEVEQYLYSVLDLGKAWGCVVLLDEADVFLEERSMSDIKRNALVSIFLRVLEYHDGIIILTSNRVGTFDEAFKSRIQLALHYPSLTKVKRYEIWTMFITRLRELGETQVDFSDLEDHRWDLADYKLNGRQIRNAIQTSRQYVSWKNAKEKTTLNFDILKEIIEISGEFDVYINKLNNGMSPDQLAEEDGLRLAEVRE